ncbi:MAG: hypothetical protein O2955_11820 [Planctomycetota bacterium]|nr:hypothetical protein [Planctomycetota bacterium]MDA1213198.1 hypothetical protein [Planctomycetota bacterium]
MTTRETRYTLTAIGRMTVFPLVIVLTGSLLGCSGSANTPPAESTDNSPPKTKGSSKQASPSKNDEAIDDDTTDDSHVQTKGQKWIGDIPYDVWFDSPLEIVNTEGNVVANAETDKNMSANPGDPDSIGDNGSTSPPDSASSTESSGPTDWATLLPQEIIEAEIKSIRNDLNNGLQSVSQYNAHYKEIEVDGAVLAAIAMIIPDHPAELTWKPNAKYVRSLGQQISTNSTALGKKSFDATKEPFEKVVSVLSGNEPAGLEDVPETVPFADTISRGEMMKRMQKCYDWMRKNVPAENVLMEQGERIRHEAALLATLGTIINLEGYTSADEEQYQQYAQSLIESCQTVIDAAGNGQFDEYSSALDKIYKACNDCHVDYRGE